MNRALTRSTISRSLTPGTISRTTAAAVGFSEYTFSDRVSNRTPPNFSSRNFVYFASFMAFIYSAIGWNLDAAGHRPAEFSLRISKPSVNRRAGALRHGAIARNRPAESPARAPLRGRRRANCHTDQCVRSTRHLEHWFR